MVYCQGCQKNIQMKHFTYILLRKAEIANIMKSMLDGFQEIEN